jgi:hypothetical protein
MYKPEATKEVDQYALALDTAGRYSPSEGGVNLPHAWPEEGWESCLP